MARREFTISINFLMHTHVLKYYSIIFSSHIEPIAFTGSHFGDGIYPIIYSNMGCVGPESSIADCTKNEYSGFSCPRNRVAGALCGYG